MKYIRKQLTVDAMKMQADGVMGGIEIKKGDFLLTHSDGSVSAIPEDVFLANYEVSEGAITTAQNKPSNSAEVAQVIPPVKQAVKDLYTCLGCSQDFPLSCFDKQQGICFDCLKVKCPTCGTPNKLSDMKGNYCPNCLRTPAL